MKNIEIKFSKKKPYKVKNSFYSYGELILNGIKEDVFSSNTSDWWSKEEYEQQWMDGLNRLYVQDKSCLITNIIDPRILPSITMYALYKTKDKIQIQAFIIYGSNYRKLIGIKAFTIETCYNYIPERYDGPMSQWLVPIETK